MAPLRTAIAVKRGTTSAYRGNPDPEWTAGIVPNGGYLLSFITEACIQNQANSEHPDPMHVTAHFLQPTRISTFEVNIRVLKKGRSFTNIIADLVQSDRTCITTHFIFAKIPPRTQPLIDPASSYGRSLPLSQHPSKAVETETPHEFTFVKERHIRWAEDPRLLSQNDIHSPNRPLISGQGVSVWGAWVELTDKDERLTPASLSFFADCFMNMPLLFPKSVTGIDADNLWLPTLNMSLEFKTPIPPPSATHSARTVGVYVISGFMSDPQGRHDTYIEIWTAPSSIGEDVEVTGWRESQVCLGIATQMQLIKSAQVGSAKL
ncbi:thioesterase-like superfamily-domain-containing protein [Mycena rebaudengoi]|nr:thioesterase-like superfamily-domain-containing protein [Mycena rebaudengoi]